jgi:hypothetical protein
MGDQQRGQDDLLPRTAEEHGSVSNDDLERAEQPELDEMCHATPPAPRWQLCVTFDLRSRSVTICGRIPRTGIRSERTIQFSPAVCRTVIAR